MNWFDWSILATYLVAILTFALWHARRREDAEGYFLAGRSVPAWIAGTSLYAQSSSAVSFVGVPAFVALQPKGGLQLLQFQVLGPLASMLRMRFIVPPLYRSGVHTVYEFFHRRFGARVRWLHGGTFLVSRGIGTAVQMHATVVVLEVVTGLTPLSVVLLIGGASLLYASLSGLRGDIYSDVVQALVFLAGIGVAIWLSLELLGWGDILSHVAASRLTIFDFSAHGFGDGETFASWPVLVGGLLASLSIDSTDQTSVQRQLATSSVRQTQHAVLYQNGLALLFTVLLVAFGVILTAMLARDPAMKAAMAQASSHNELVPRFLLAHVPHGLLGLLVAAMFAATMSSVDSALNALSLTTMRDFVEPLGGAPVDPQQYVKTSRLVTAAWGVLCTGLSLFVGKAAATIIVAFRKLGALFLGPMFATFVAAVAMPSVGPRGMFVGIVTGVAANLALWHGDSLGLPGISFYWWTPISFTVALAVARLVDPQSSTSDLRTPLAESEQRPSTSDSSASPRWYIALAGLSGALFVTALFGQRALRKRARF